MLGCAIEKDCSKYKAEGSAIIFLLAALLTIITIIFSCWSRKFLVSDGLAQFMPGVVVGSRAVLHGHLPLINYFQFRGQPILETGYFPVLYPPAWFSYLIAHFLFNNDQETWNILCSLQLILNALAVYSLCRITFQIRKSLSLAAALTVSSLGMVLYQGGEWFYALATYGFAPLLILLIDLTVRKESYRYAVWSGIALSLFVYASNVQFVFYAMHLVFVISLARLLGRILDGEKPGYKRLLVNLLCMGSVFLFATLPYLIGVRSYIERTNRSANSVTEDKYYWISSSWPEVLLKSVFPGSGVDRNEGSLSIAAYAIGVFAGLGLIALPVFWIMQFRRRTVSKGVLLQSVMFGVLAIATLLLSLGKPGVLAELLYHVPPYNWFRHSLKWLHSFQLMAAILSVFILDQIIKLKSRHQNIAAYSLLCCALAYALYATYVFPNSSRFTEALGPVPDPINFPQTHRVVGLWHQGEVYKGQEPKYILGHNYASIFGKLSLVGYEPLGTRDNTETAFQFFPGYYLDAKTIPIPHLVKHSVRFLLIPSYQSDLIFNELTTHFPKHHFEFFNKDDSSPATAIEIKDVDPIVRGSGVKLLNLEVSSYAIKVKFVSNKPTKLRFDIGYDKSFVCLIDGEAKPISRDEKLGGGIAVEIDRAGTHSALLYYKPPFVIPMISGWLVALVALGASFRRKQ